MPRSWQGATRGARAVAFIQPAVWTNWVGGEIGPYRGAEIYGLNMAAAFEIDFRLGETAC